jgi:hypothetical protein
MGSGTMSRWIGLQMIRPTTTTQCFTEEPFGSTQLSSAGPFSGLRPILVLATSIACSVKTL